MVIAAVSPYKVMMVFNPFLPKTGVFSIISHTVNYPLSSLVCETPLLPNNLPITHPL